MRYEPVIALMWHTPSISSFLPLENRPGNVAAGGFLVVEADEWVSAWGCLASAWQVDSAEKVLSGVELPALGKLASLGVLHDGLFGPWGFIASVSVQKLVHCRR